MESSATPTGSSSRPPLVFVPALMGTELYRDSQKVYVTIPIALSLATPNIALPIQWHRISNSDSAADCHRSIPRQEMDDIRPVEALKRLDLGCSPCGGFCSYTVLDQYSTLCNHFHQQADDIDFYEYAYDWRRDLNESTDKLISFLQKIASKHGQAPQVMAHSMGCLIALAALHEQPSLFHSILLAGGNFGGGAGFYPMNTEGMTVGWNRRYLSGEVVHTFPSMYAAASPMMEDPILRRTCQVIKEDGTISTSTRYLFQFVNKQLLRDEGKWEVVPIDMWNIQDWKKYKLGPWSLDKEVSKEVEDHVQICLEVGLVFQRRLRNVKQSASDGTDGTKEQCYPRVAVLVGDQHLNPDYFLWDVVESHWIEWTPELIEQFCPRHFERTDGTVSHISASQPPGLPSYVNVEEYKAKQNGIGIGEHRELMSEVELIDSILHNLCETSN